MKFVLSDEGMGRNSCIDGFEYVCFAYTCFMFSILGMFVCLFFSKCITLK